MALSLHSTTTPLQGVPQYALLVFLLIPALVLAIVALFWVPPRICGGGPLPEGNFWRLALVLLFLAAFVTGLLR